jgi:hypothetical protein
MGKEENSHETKKMSAADKKAYGDYNAKMMAEHDVETMMSAEAIKKDKPRLRKAMHCAKMKREEMNNVISEG